MIQEFFKSTIISKYIKYLLSNTPLPIIPLTEPDKYLIKDCIYIDKQQIIKCTKSGYYSDLNLNFKPLTPSQDLTVTSKTNYLIKQNPATLDYVTSSLTPTNSLVKINPTEYLATYDIINTIDYDKFIPGLTQKFISTTSYYDEITHKFLGDYLRLIKNRYNLNLMSLYNCFNYKIGEEVYIEENTNTDGERYTLTNNVNDRYKMVLVPIKFNTTYTVALDSALPILIKGIIYDNGLIPWSSDTDTRLWLSDTLSDKVIKYSSTQFSKPFTYRLPNTMVMQQNYESKLYLGIQLPKEYNSTIVVLEGDYTRIPQKNIADIAITNTNNENIDKTLRTIPSLLTVNDGAQHPFSEKLISYLIRNTIDNRDTIDENVSGVEDKLGYRPTYKDVWDNKLRYILYDRYTSITNKDINKTDILGFVDIDIENALDKKYLTY